MSARYPHVWKRSWPGNFCVECGADDPIELAISCPDCIFDYPGPNDDFKAYVPKPPKLCPAHQELVDDHCPATQAAEDFD